jgi:hypothetical protein
MSTNGKGEDLEDLDEIMTDDEFYTELDDDRRAELEEMVSAQVLGVELYEDSMGDDEEAEPVTPEARTFFDCDVYLDNNQALELYVTTAYPDPDKDPVQGLDAIFDALGRLADNKLELLDYGQADDEGGLALAFGHDEKVEMVLVAGAWMVSEWEPEDEEAAE